MDCEPRKLGMCQLGEVSNDQSNKAELEQTLEMSDVDHIEESFY
jgi:hypothetical protein